MAYTKLLLSSGLVFLSTLVSYLIFEFGFYLLLCFGLPAPMHPYYDYAAWSNPRFMRATVDEGVRIQENESMSGIRVTHGDVQFYFENITGNAAGFHSRLQYSYKKTGYRIVVYGDSFTAMLYEREPWPDYLNNLYAGTGTEVYNFAIDGAGLANWLHHYVTDLVPHYEFDMVIFAICCDDLFREFTVGETRNDGYFIRRFDERPRDTIDLEKNFLPHLYRIVGHAEPDFLKALNDHFSKNAFMRLPFDFYALRAAQGLLFAPKAPPQQYLPPVINKVQRKLLVDILRDLHARQKVAVLLALPWSKAGESADHQLAEIKALAEQGCAIFVNGYQYLEKNSVEIPGHWARYDGHWLRGAANSFVDKIAPEFLNLRDAAGQRSCPPPVE